MSYTPKYTKRWIKNLKKYISMKKDILSKVEKIIEDPELHTREALQGKSSARKLNLTGLRSAAVRDKYRIIFILCKDCNELRIKEGGIFFCEKCEEEHDDMMIKFLAFGSHDDAYFMK
jgi:mRNA-degrading endonuclease YafQ of YafQ-DinJ toxin-antitoxin module